MKKNGALLAFFVFVSCVFAQGAEAKNIFEFLFGSNQRAQAPVYLEPHRQYPDYVMKLRTQKAHHGFAAKHTRYTDLRRKSRKHFAAKFQAPRRQVASLDVSKPAARDGSVTKPCCANAQEAINQIVNSDETLRPGDAYMTGEGLRIYVGSKDTQFVPIDKARHIDDGLKKRLASLGGAQARQVAADTGIKGKSDPQRSALLERASKEKLVLGPKGKLIRFVGGSLN